MSNEYQENNYTKIDLTRSYDKNISSLKRMIVHLPWWSHFFTILIILYCCERVYAKLSSISRESSYRLLVHFIYLSIVSILLENNEEDMVSQIAIRELLSKH